VAEFGKAVVGAAMVWLMILCVWFW